MKKLRFLLWFGVPMVLGTIGFLKAGEGLLQSLFQSVQLYLVEYGDPPANILVEIARWLAPLATAGSVLMALAVLRRKLRNLWLYHKGGCTVVYGPDAIKHSILKQLDESGIDGGDEFVRGQRYILLRNEQDNLRFYHRYREELENAEVYMECTSLPARAVDKDNLHLFCPEETAAKLFWKRNGFYSLSKRHNHALNVVLIGFGKLGEEVLTAGLQYNVFHPQQKIAYHIFGADDEYAATHTQLHQIGDAVVFHKEPWYGALDLLETAEVIIVLQQEDQLALLRKLLLSVNKTKLHVFALQEFGAEILDGQDRLEIFHWEKEARCLENIVGDALYRRAKRINLRYAALYKGVAETEENLRAEWSMLDSFTRYSNISAADYYDMLCEILQTEGYGQCYTDIPAEWKERLAELEHMRWCRYYYLNNWQYSIPEGGKHKDSQLRLHTDLIPYEALSEADKEKDRENIRVIFSVMGDESPV